MAWRATAAKGVHELRFALCQTSPASEGARRVPPATPARSSGCAAIALPAARPL
jgi:hypothetical protein